MSKLKLEVSFHNDRQMNEFVNMLAWMELCGNVGHCTDFTVRLDGDGAARPKFKFETEELQKSYDELRQSFLNNEFKQIPLYPNGMDIHICIE